MKLLIGMLLYWGDFRSQTIRNHKMKKTVFFWLGFILPFTLFSQGLGDELSDFIRSGSYVCVHKTTDDGALFISHVSGEKTSEMRIINYYFYHYVCKQIRIYTTSYDDFKDILKKLTDGLKEEDENFWIGKNFTITAEIEKGEKNTEYWIYIFENDYIEKRILEDKRLDLNETLKQFIGQGNKAVFKF